MSTQGLAGILDECKYLPVDSLLQAQGSIGYSKQTVSLIIDEVKEVHKGKINSRSCQF